jgi:membrane-anchored protein YejM (alkaline phosphatase superfamily)
MEVLMTVRNLNRILVPYFLFIYVLFVLTEILFTLRINTWSAGVVLILVPSLFCYPFLQLLPAVAVSQLTAYCTCKWNKAGVLITGVLTVLCVYIVHLFLLLDAGLYFRYGYHVNPHIINIFTTPGGIEGMGMRPLEMLWIAAGVTALGVIHAGIFLLFAKVEKLQFKVMSLWKAPAVLAVLAGVSFLISYFTCTYSHYVMNPSPLQAADCIPFYINGTAGSFYKKLGFKKPAREAVVVKFSNKSHLESYPAAHIRRNKKKAGFNVLWIACESWAAKLFSPEIMPNATAFAKKGIFFKNHYSGGNVTRQGVFSMFYALPGNYWHAFLAARRRPVFIDWLVEDGYNFECLTSSKFTYPEFDQTVFFSVPKKDLTSDSDGLSFERDQRNVKRLLKSLEEESTSGKPFFNFMFFESCHHPYSFPEEATFYKDYIEPFNAVNATAAQGPAIFKRAANAARHLDMRLGEVFDFLEKKNLLKNTIVILAGDHGEEYFEKGRLGHSSAFNNEQTRTPLIIYYPRVQPRVYDKMSSHLDIVPMLAGFFGVENKPEDYSCGINLLDTDSPERKYALIANWDEVFFAGKKYKSYIPMDVDDIARQIITDADDNELDDINLFYKEYGADLIRVQHDLTRFTAPFQKTKSDGGKFPLIPAVITGMIVVFAGCIFFKYRRKSAENN